ncbi:MAG: RHS repeat-associated core domain-containing protein [Bacteroidia bacterium]
MTTMLASAQADPFGLRMSGENTLVASPGNEYLYNGKELQTELGLGWYDYGARMYAPDEGRWKGVDALGELYANYGAYTYVLNSPINLIDPDGQSVQGIAGQRAKTSRPTTYYGPDVSLNNISHLLGNADPGETFHRITGEKIHDDGLSDGRVYVGIKTDGSDREYVGQRQDIPDKTLDAYETINNFKKMAIQLRFDVDHGVLTSGYLSHKIVTIWTWKQAVTDHSYFDSKNDKESLLYKKTFPEIAKFYGFFEGRLLRYDAFGNLAFGAAAKAYGLSLTLNLFGGGMNQLYKGWELDFSPEAFVLRRFLRRTGHPLGGPSTFFDTEKDAYWVKYGYNNF